MIQKNHSKLKTLRKDFLLQGVCYVIARFVEIKFKYCIVIIHIYMQINKTFRNRIPQ